MLTGARHASIAKPDKKEEAYHNEEITIGSGIYPRPTHAYASAPPNNEHEQEASSAARQPSK